MSDVISAKFEADANDFVREVNKARESVKKMSGDAPKMRQEMDAAFQKTTAGAKNTGAGLMQLAYFADDAQYGVKGLMNNIPGLAMSLGAGMGLAGGLSLAVLAGAKLAPVLGELTGLTDNYAEALAEMELAQKNVLANFDKQRAAVKESLAAQESIKKQKMDIDRGVAAIQDVPRADLDEAEIAAIRKKVEAQKEMLRLESQLAQARAKTDVEKSAVVVDSQQKMAALDAAAINEELKIRARMEEQIVGALSEKMKLSEREMERMKAEEGFLQKAITQLQAKKLEQEELRASAEAMRDAMKNAGYDIKAESKDPFKLKTDSDDPKVAQVVDHLRLLGVAWEETIGKWNDFNPSSLDSAIRTSTEEAARLAAQIEEGKKRAALLAEGMSSVKSATEGAVNAMNQESARQVEAQNAARAKLEQYEKTKNLVNEIATAERRAMAEKQAASERERAAEVRKAQGVAREDVFGEVQALALQVQGRVREADALREGMKLRRDAAALAERAGISEKQAAMILERKLELEKALAGEKRKSEQQNDGRIRLFKRGESAGGAFGGGAREGLGASVVERNVRIAEQRAAARGDSGAGVTRTVEKLDDLYTVMRKQLEVWQTGLGVK